jgi:hypothetical protein
MHPISIRGRSMSRDRRAVRAFFVIVGILGWSLSTGCLRSTMLRPANGPAAQPALPGGPGPSVLAPSAPPASKAPAGQTAMPPTKLQAAPTSIQDQAALAPLTPQAPPTIPPITAPDGEAPVTNPTPLMDAAIERVAAVTQLQRESLESTQPPSERDDNAATAVASGSPAVVPTASAQKRPPLLVADITESSPEVAPTATKSIESPTQSSISSAPKDEAQRIVLETPTKITTIAGTESLVRMPEIAGTRLDETQPVAATVSAVAGDLDPLSIGKLCLCRKILGFGSFEPFKESQVKAGQLILLYCEMTGMQYESKDASFVSRLASKIEIGSVENGAFQWALELGPAVDVCGSRRHDFFVNYKLSVPPTLPPGSYRLRLTQTDLVANRSSSAEIPLVIAR